MAEGQKHVREYETVFLVKPELTDDNVDQVKERMYPIAKQARAIYVHAHYLGNTKLVAEIERNLRNFDEVTRFLSLKLADMVDPASKPTLEDVKMAGDVDERPGVPERDGFRPEGADPEPRPEFEEEMPEEG
jgi:small subunit ribosomal protein S6